MIDFYKEATYMDKPYIDFFAMEYFKMYNFKKTHEAYDVLSLLLSAINIKSLSLPIVGNDYRTEAIKTLEIIKEFELSKKL